MVKISNPANFGQYRLFQTPRLSQHTLFHCYIHFCRNRFQRREFHNYSNRNPNRRRYHKNFPLFDSRKMQQAWRSLLQKEVLLWFSYVR